ncbi:hypothetical protein LINPERHAP1_LOCUS41943 [Linum perenne]
MLGTSCTVEPQRLWLIWLGQL